MSNRNLTPEEKEYIWNEYIRILPDVIEAQGLYNVVGGLTTHVEALCIASQEGSSLQRDLHIAATELDMVMGKCDLEYK